MKQYVELTADDLYQAVEQWLDLRGMKVVGTISILPKQEGDKVLPCAEAEVDILPYEVRYTPVQEKREQQENTDIFSEVELELDREAKWRTYRQIEH